MIFFEGLTIGKINFETPDDIEFNRALFPSSHNSYSKCIYQKIEGTLEKQLERGICSFEFDIHYDEETKEQNFTIGHLLPGDDLYNEDSNPSSIYLKDWLEYLIDKISDKGINSPIVIWFDIKNILTSLKKFNAFLGEIFKNTKLFTPKMYKEEYEFKWPKVSVLKGHKIIIFTGSYIKHLKYDYDNTSIDESRNYFISFAYTVDGLGIFGNSKMLLDNSRFVNATPLPMFFFNWEWANRQFRRGKIVRLYNFDFDVYRLKSNSKFFKDYKCNFPATNFPFKNWYEEACNALQENNLVDYKK